MRLSENFVLEEFTKSQTAERQGIDNTPSENVINNLETTVKNICQPIRDHFNKPVYINSGYRSPELNRAIGGSDTSQHTTGQAADMEIPKVSNYDLAVYIRDNLDFDQLILEGYHSGRPNSGWVHCSYVSQEENRREIMTATFENGQAQYTWGLNK